MTHTASTQRSGHEDVEQDHVVLLHPDGSVRGLAPRSTVHTADTPLHLAFSCYVVRADGRVLLTRRALGKRAWPGVWTNSLCGHPRRHEEMAEAVHRHAGHELGMTVSAPRPALPDFRYRAVDASGVVENEICPVFVVDALSPPVANPEEVLELQWVTPEELGDAVRLTPWALSPWCVEQVPGLTDQLLPTAGTAADR